jgi:hypothetical protein
MWTPCSGLELAKFAGKGASHSAHHVIPPPPVRLGFSREINRLRSFGFEVGSRKFAHDSLLEGNGFELKVPVRQTKLTRRTGRAAVANEPRCSSPARISALSRYGGGFGPGVLTTAPWRHPDLRSLRGAVDPWVRGESLSPPGRYSILQANITNRHQHLGPL